MKKLILLLILLLIITSCSPAATQLEEINETEEVTEETIETPEPYYNFSERESQEILSKTITLNKIYTTAQIDLTVDNTETTIKNTGVEEIIENLKITMISTNHGFKESYVIIKIEPLKLDDKQYLLKQNEIERINGKYIKLDESKSNGNIELTIYNSASSSSGSSITLKHDQTEELNGLTFTNVKNYYTVKQYAIIKIE